MAFYGDGTKAEKLASVDIGNVTTEMKDAINEWIDANIKRSGFVESELITEYYDIKKKNQDELIVKYFPIIEINSLIHGYYHDEPTALLEGEDFTVDADSGIIQLLLTSFYLGFNSVQIIYKHGYDTVPSIIEQIATLMAAKWAKIRTTTVSDSDGSEILKSIKIGDYSESYDLGFMNIKSEFDDMLIPLIEQAKIFYANGV